MKVTDIIAEAKQSKDAPKPRNFVAKNAINTGAGAHKDKKKAEKQGDVKHKKQAVPMDEGLRDPKDNPCWKGYKPVGTKKKGGKTVPNCVPKESVEEMYGRRSYGYNPDRDAERAWDAGKRAEQDFRNRERNAGLEDEEEYYQQQVAMQREKDRGPWYLKINGKILKSQGQPKVFDWKKGANNYALAILKNKPELQGKIFLTKRAEDDTSTGIAETATVGATNAASVGTVVSPHLAIGKDRGKKSYTGSPGKSGTKAPAVPKTVQKKNPDGTAKNALDMPNNIFGGGAVKR